PAVAAAAAVRRTAIAGPAVRAAHAGTAAAAVGRRATLALERLDGLLHQGRVDPLDRHDLDGPHGPGGLLLQFVGQGLDLFVQRIVGHPDQAVGPLVHADGQRVRPRVAVGVQPAAHHAAAAAAAAAAAHAPHAAEPHHHARAAEPEPGVAAERAALRILTD